MINLWQRISGRIKNNRYIERMGTGVGDMVERCRNTGLPEPEFYLTDGFVTIIRRSPGQALKTVTGQATPQVIPQVTPQVSPPVEVLLRLLDLCGALSNAEIRKRLGLKDRKHMNERYLKPALVEGLVELTIPEKPRSSLQKYRLTEKGHFMLDRESS
jgi:ATP-dependent DNA helicase RecG